MTGTERALHERIAWLKASIAVIRMTPPLWPFCWPALCLLESELALLDRLAPKPEARAEWHAPANVVDLASWRRRRDTLRGRLGAAAGA
ncbi:MAG TPA: hypothetical protein VF502_03375 [Stellaceae bacterium]